MKYRLKNKRTGIPSHDLKGSRLRAKRLYRGKSEEPIDFISLFEFSEEYEVSLPVPRKKPSIFSKILFWLKKTVSNIGNKLRERIKRKRERRKNRPETLYMLLGAGSASILVSILSVSIVLLSLFGSYSAPYTTVTVPDLVGTLYDESAEESGELFSYVVDYEYNPNVPAGYVISQTPPANTQRRVYSKNGHCLISLTVSHAKAAYKLEELVGFSERDASLILRNNGLIPEIKKEYSSTVEHGTVIKMSPDPDKIMADGERVTLTVSIGPQIILCAVPNVCGLTETQAATRIISAGLICGQTIYSVSELPAGTVIAQSIDPKKAVEENTAIDITVSIGRGNLKTVPDLYGMTEDEARVALREYGLVLGVIIPVGSAEAKGTVIAQTPFPNTPITSSTVAVDVYVSS